MMRFNSARQVWHDAYYVPSRDKLEVMEKATKVVSSGGRRYRLVTVTTGLLDDDGNPIKERMSIPLMNASQDRSSADNCIDIWDQNQRDKVKSVIWKMDKKLRAFGMIMYAPDPMRRDDDVELIHELLQVDLYNRFDLSGLRPKTIIALRFLIFAAIQYHRDITFGGRSPLENHHYLASWLMGMYGVPIKVANWARDFEPYWSNMRSGLDSLERAALAPLAKLVEEERAKREEVA